MKFIDVVGRRVWLDWSEVVIEWMLLLLLVFGPLVSARRLSVGGAKRWGIDLLRQTWWFTTFTDRPDQMVRKPFIPFFFICCVSRSFGSEFAAIGRPRYKYFFGANIDSIAARLMKPPSLGAVCVVSRLWSFSWFSLHRFPIFGLCGRRWGSFWWNSWLATPSCSILKIFFLEELAVVPHWTSWGIWLTTCWTKRFKSDCIRSMICWGTPFVRNFIRRMRLCRWQRKSAPFLIFVTFFCRLGRCVVALSWRMTFTGLGYLDAGPNWMRSVRMGILVQFRCCCCVRRDETFDPRQIGKVRSSTESRGT